MAAQPGGEPNPAPPGWYAQPYPPYPPPYEEQGRNGFSIAGLVLGIIPITAGLLGIIFGLIGRSQAKSRGQKGRVMGTWGAALGAVWLTLAIIGVVADLNDDAERDRDGRVSQAGEESAFSLRVGDCVRSLPADLSEIEQVDLVPCSRAHSGEVYAALKLSGSSYPGDKAASLQSEKLCVGAFEAFDGKAYNDSALDVIYLRPTARTWNVGDRGITCLVSGKDLVGTAKGSKR